MKIIDIIYAKELKVYPPALNAAFGRYVKKRSKILPLCLH